MKQYEEGSILWAIGRHKQAHVAAAMQCFAFYSNNAQMITLKAWIRDSDGMEGGHGRGRCLRVQFYGLIQNEASAHETKKRSGNLQPLSLIFLTYRVNGRK